MLYKSIKGRWKHRRETERGVRIISRKAMAISEELGT